MSRKRTFEKECPLKPCSIKAAACPGGVRCKHRNLAKSAISHDNISASAIGAAQLLKEEFETKVSTLLNDVAKFVAEPVGTTADKIVASKIAWMNRNLEEQGSRDLWDDVQRKKDLTNLERRLKLLCAEFKKLKHNQCSSHAR